MEQVLLRRSACVLLKVARSGTRQTSLLVQTLNGKQGVQIQKRNDATVHSARLRSSCPVVSSSLASGNRQRCSQRKRGVTVCACIILKDWRRTFTIYQRCRLVVRAYAQKGFSNTSALLPKKTDTPCPSHCPVKLGAPGSGLSVLNAARRSYSHSSRSNGRHAPKPHGSSTLQIWKKAKRPRLARYRVIHQFHGRAIPGDSR